MAASPEFQNDVFVWLESIIKCELLGTETVISELDGQPLPRPRFEEDGRRHPGTLPLPNVQDMDPEEFKSEFERVVNDLVRAYNWHEHTDTCWKYLRPSEPKDDAHCRMRINGTTRAITGLDEESGSILLRRLHPRIANFNDIVIFLMQCNMDIKHIGSGQAANALMYYFADYISKDGLPTHVGLAALLYAVQRISAKKLKESPLDDLPVSNALIITINRMLSRQEISHQQVMSYLVGGGDHYTSHRFRLLYFGAFER